MSIQTRPREDLMKMLDENHYLILQIADLQNKGRVSDCHLVQKHLLKNLLYLGTVANNQVKKEELLLSPSTRSNLRVCSKATHIATIPIANLDTDNCLKPNEALPGAAKHKALAVTAPPQETPMIVGPTCSRKLQSTLAAEAPHSSRPWVRVDVPGSSNLTSESLSNASQVAGADLFSQRPVTVTVPQTSQVLPSASTVCCGDTARIQVVPNLSTHVIQPTGPVLQLQNPATASSFSKPISIPITSDFGQTHADTSMPMNSSSSSSTPVQQYIATMTPQGMILVPLKTSP
ncbi:hypothetical protein BIW11_06461 [Tropilaelaps mercedesae]|uniref:SS18 N-terminal domain-containing protein n=1 Tax=Tropilaelaps mercedesae TaxID=418985 RepID=A0A1V9XY21_9ACAR|nr:hypothetical protein BIW11_06461 [Tropilaelaps mercedesae]